MMFNGNRLQKARIYRGLSVDELSKELHVTRQRIYQLESGNETPSVETMLAITEKLKFPPNFFMQDSEAESHQLGSTYFRSLLTTSKKYQQEQIVKMEFIASIHDFLNKYINFPSLDIPELGYYGPEEAAIRLRDYWTLGDGPVDRLTLIMENHGIIVTSYQTSSTDIDAFSHKLDDRFIVVLSKNKDCAARSNFDAAHELGHIVLHNWKDDLSSLSREEFRQREKEANDFASAFLMPATSFDRSFKAERGRGLEPYVRLKQKWQTSIAAILYRARSMELISSVQYQSTCRLLNKRGWLKHEPYDDFVRFTPPVLFKSAVKLLLDEKVFTANSFMQELGKTIDIPYDQVEMLLDLPIGMLAPQYAGEGNILKLNLM